VSRRVTLPGADELFRTTGTATRPETEPTETSADPVSTGPGTAGPSAGAPVTAIRTRRTATRTSGTRRPSGRERHDEKITVYVSADELVAIEQARLVLRAEHGVAVDRGRLVREAVAEMLLDLEQHGEASVVVARLREQGEQREQREQS
jgi:hypothetical protein